MEKKEKDKLLIGQEQKGLSLDFSKKLEEKGSEVGPNHPFFQDDLPTVRTHPNILPRFSSIYAEPKNIIPKKDQQFLPSKTDLLKPDHFKPPF
jgi:hypothetical protein